LSLRQRLRFEDLPPPIKNESISNYCFRVFGVDVTKNDHTKRMVNYQKKQDENNRKMVINTLKEMTKPVTSNEILNFINKNIRQNVEQEIKNKTEVGDITISNKKPEKEYFNELYKKKKIDIKTVQRHLKTLIEQGVVVKIPKSDYYSLLNMLNLDIKFDPNGFGHGILRTTMQYIHPHHHILEENIQRLVESFGVYLLYCFIEGSRPYIYKDNNKKPSIILDIDKKDQLTLSWIENAIDSKEMFGYFLTLMRDQLNDNQIKTKYENNKHSFECNKEDEYLINNLHAFRFWNPEYFHPDSELIKKRQSPKYELDINKIDIVRQILKDKYGSIISNLENAFDKFDMEIEKV
jgi:hypothetical protein